MRGPGLAGFRLHVGEPGAGRRIGNADEVLARRALNLASGELRFALQGLVAVGTVEFEFVCAHSFHLFMRKPDPKSIGKILHTFSRPNAHVGSDE
jgi:hypothetical protein